MTCLFVIGGQVALNGETLGKGDQARIREEELLAVAATAPSDLVLWDTHSALSPVRF